MMRAPWFWRSRSLTARSITAALTPLSYLYQAGHHLRWALTRPARAGVPVICIGNATLGGAGKTPFAILVAQLLQSQGVKTCFLTRGYRGALAGPVLVDSGRHDARDVGDEALLLARHGRVIVARNRPAGVKLAGEAGAQAVIMDDGFQNPTLHKDFSILLIGEDETASNGALFPAGPYRETPASARLRADITVSIGAAGRNAEGGADFRAQLRPNGAPSPERVLAFAGIGQPEKFFRTLEESGFDLVQKISFPDHHPFTPAELQFLMREARRNNARLICTEKDHVRLPDDIAETVLTLPVVMKVDNRDELSARLMRVMTAPMHDEEQSAS